jgi:ribonuclease Y
LFCCGVAFRKRIAEKEISSAEEEAKRIINESIKSAESKKREALVRPRKEIHRNRAEYDREVRESRAQLLKQERSFSRRKSIWTKSR